MKRSPQFNAARIARSRAIFRTILRDQVALAGQLNATMGNVRKFGPFAGEVRKPTTQGDTK